MSNKIFPVGDWTIWTTIRELEFALANGLIATYQILEKKGEYVKASIVGRINEADIL